LVIYPDGISPSSGEKILKWRKWVSVPTIYIKILLFCKDLPGEKSSFTIPKYPLYFKRND
jgi:hypothetical protein